MRPWRGFYRRLGRVFVIAAIGPEAEHDTRGFERTIQNATTRLEDLEIEGGHHEAGRYEVRVAGTR